MRGECVCVSETDNVITYMNLDRKSINELARCNNKTNLLYGVGGFLYQCN